MTFMDRPVSDNRSHYSERSSSIHDLPSRLGALLDPRWLRAFGQHLWDHFKNDRSFESAGALSYTSLLALVPLMAVILGVLSAFPVFDRAVEQLQDFVFSNFVPAAGETVRQYLDQFVARSAQLTGTGTLFLVITALILMATIERVLNRIWRVDRPRRASSRLLVYWAVLTLGPLLLGASLGLTSYVATLPAVAPEFVRNTLQTITLALAPFFVALLAFTLVFVIVPNRQVRFNHALAGAALSALAFEISKRGFVLYISNFPTYEKIYGALAAVPIFLVWIYVSWVVILLGASLAAALTTFKYRPKEWRWNRRHYLLLTVRLVGHLWNAQLAGREVSTADLLECEPAATDEEIEMLLERLVDAGLVHRDSDGDWLLSADLEAVSLGDLYRTMPLVLPVAERRDLPESSSFDGPLGEALGEIDDVADPLMQRSLKSYLKVAQRGADERPREARSSIQSG
jgi:membrane protein